jgi:adenylosuccinate synthase
MNCCVTGLQWGDEGKGKVVDILAEKRATAHGKEGFSEDA